MEHNCLWIACYINVDINVNYLGQLLLHFNHSYITIACASDTMPWQVEVFFSALAEFVAW